MPDQSPDSDWDYWEKQRHKRAHSEEGIGCIGAALVVALALFCGIPLAIVVADFYGATVCTARWIDCTGKPQLLPWNVKR